MGNSGCLITHLILSLLVLSDQKIQLNCLVEATDTDRQDQKSISSSSKISVFLNMHQLRSVRGKGNKLISFQGFYLLGISF